MSILFVLNDLYVLGSQVGLAVLAHLLVGPLSILAGVRRHPGYRLWQPLKGGTVFVVAQACDPLILIPYPTNPNHECFSNSRVSLPFVPSP